MYVKTCLHQSLRNIIRGLCRGIDDTQLFLPQNRKSTLE